MRRKRKPGSRRVRRKRPNLLKSFSKYSDVLGEDITLVDCNCRLQVLRSEKTPSKSRCPEAKDKDGIVEDSVPQIKEAVLPDEDLRVMAQPVLPEQPS